MNRLALFPKFLQTWLETHWRSLLLLLVGVYLPLQLFVILALQTWKLEGGLAWEVPLMMAIHNRASESVDHAAELLTKLGSAKRVAPVVVTIAFAFFLQKRWRSLIYLLMTLFGCGVTNVVAKAFWHRVRPHLWEGYALPQDFSFPSGHAMTSMAFAAVLIILTWGSRWAWLILPLGSLYVGIIGWTRLYLGVHYPSDILAGWMLAIAWTLGMSVLIRPGGAGGVGYGVGGVGCGEDSLEISSEEAIEQTRDY
jgi:undecaprenyl-diphosphatase